MIRWNKEVFESEMIKIDSENPFENNTFLKFLSCKEFESNRTDLYKELGREELLRYRVFSYSQELKSTKNIRNIIAGHRQKAHWHVRRIYRARNLIVHSGKNPGSIEVLVKNLHNYLDQFLNQLIDFVINDIQVTSIEQAIKEVQLLNEKREKLYEDNLNIEITTENHIEYLIRYNG